MNWVRSGLVLLTAATSQGVAVAGPFDGWCFAADACTGEPMRIEADAFSTCEARCELRNPVNVNRMAAILYDAVCESDGQDDTAERMLFLRYSDGGKEQVLAISNAGPQYLSRCD